MERKLVIIKRKKKIVTLVMEESEVVEIRCCDEESEQEKTHLLGNIYIGRVKNIVPNIGAAFIEIENGVECYYPLDQNPTPIFVKKSGKKPLCIGDELIVQISREASKTKVPSVTSKIEFVGRFLIITAGNLRIGASKKIEKTRGLKLKEFLKEYENEEYGIIARTNAKDASESELIEEIQQLSTQFVNLVQTAKSRVCFSCLQKAPKAYIADIRNLYGDGLVEIKVENKDIYEEVFTYLKKEQPQNLSKLVLYEDQSFSLSKLYNVEHTIEKALQQRVWLKNGGYLVIQLTEALSVIDVNSGKFVAKKDVADSYLKINLEAAKEAAKQIRLRNLSGIIIIDFINMQSKEHTQLLLDTLKSYLQCDPIQTTLVDMTKLHLVEITRKKVRKMLYETIERDYNN